jgi:RsiW-degrading membrane proteinase PrsW (M82 family)
MILELIQHEYFWLSFFPVSFLGIGFWFLFFERTRKKKDPLIIFLIAIFGGGISAFILSFLLQKFVLENPFLVIFLEELFKILFAVGIMEMFKQKVHTIAGGIIFGFAGGLGFAFSENLLYLMN